ncbi:Uncharacterized protein HZ326_16316 [Fusarium oxysporum f. sp. albedinis]|nr:Uncharacterized protein HZ326_16316 [Fusarium oxysporum f. sp. albedinis]
MKDETLLHSECQVTPLEQNILSYRRYNCLESAKHRVNPAARHAVCWIIRIDKKNGRRGWVVPPTRLC